MKEGIHPNYQQTTITCARWKSARSVTPSSRASRSWWIPADAWPSSTRSSVWTSKSDTSQKGLPVGQALFSFTFPAKAHILLVSMERKERLHEAASCGAGAFDAGDSACLRTAAPAADRRRQDRLEYHDHRLVPAGPAVEPAGLHSLRAARALYLSIYGVPRLFHRLHPAGGGQKSDRPLRQQERPGRGQGESVRPDGPLGCRGRALL